MYYLLSTVSLIISFLPHNFLEWSARRLAFLCFAIFKIRRDVILSNLDIVYGDKLSEARKAEIGVRSWEHFLLTCIEFLYFRNGSLAAQVIDADTESFRCALGAKRGAYMIGIHMANWEAMASFISNELAPLHMVVKTVGGAGVNRFIKERRRINGLFGYERKSKGDAVRSMAKSLKQQAVVGFVMDQSYPGGKMLPLFGRPAKCNTSFSYIWRRFQAPVFVGYLERVGFGKFKAHFFGPIELVVTEDKEADAVENIARINSEIEACIVTLPEQYFWLHDRWKQSKMEFSPVPQQAL